MSGTVKLSPKKPHGAKKTKKQRKHGRWSRNGKGPKRLARLGALKLRRKARRLKWQTRRVVKAIERLRRAKILEGFAGYYGTPFKATVTKCHKYAYALACRAHYGQRRTDGDSPSSNRDSSRVVNQAQS
jgi:hypothetical protein